MSRCCSQCGSNGHNSRTCPAAGATVTDDSSSPAPAAAAGGGGGTCGSREIMLFGVRVKVDPMRKSVSMNNLSQYEQPHASSSADPPPSAAAGYASADDAAPHQSAGVRERKRGVPWTEEEHKLFLLGLQKVGKGDWRGISRNYVKTRTPTQVASHAQKYFLRRSNLNRRRRRSSLFDITTDSVTAIPMEEDQSHQGNTTQRVLQPQPMPQPEISNISGFPLSPFPVTVRPLLLPVQAEIPMESLTLGNGSDASTMLVGPIASVGLDASQKLALGPSPLSLKLSLSSNQNQSSARHSAFQVVSSLSSKDNMISVA
ncbi:hypothetical protein RJ639_015609 [Escallonia herrerae]|uniref:MYB transcription factor n=1 Tax=Escallonia herrerae TaxID=1293975 RepID=A0AA88VEU6_9ASTE|nr:hypothetical protein RJ639_015609 [Escallonia herrerae]